MYGGFRYSLDLQGAEPTLVSERAVAASWRDPKSGKRSTSIAADWSRKSRVPRASRLSARTMAFRMYRVASDRSFLRPRGAPQIRTI